MIDTLELIYHCNYKKIEYPYIKKSKFTKDFSWGFYCNSSRSEAEKLSEFFYTGKINVYKINDIESLNIKVFKEYSEEWLEFVIQCRNGNLHNYDVVIGPVADDSIYDYIDSYYKGKMNKTYFLRKMKNKYNYKQISLHTIKALEKTLFVEWYEIKKIKV